MPQFDSSRPGYELATGDLARVRVGPLEAARIIVQQTEGGQREPDNTALLAALLKDSVKSNCNFTVYAVHLVGGALGQQQQILGENPLRQALYFSKVLFSGAAFILFEPGPLQPADISAIQFTTMTRRAFPYTTSVAIDFLYVPTNAITMFVAPAVTADIVVIEGT